MISMGMTSQISPSAHGEMMTGGVPPGPLVLGPSGPEPVLLEISNSQGGFTGQLEAGDNLGSSVASVGDLDGDGIGDLAVGADGDNDGRAGRSSSIRNWLKLIGASGVHDANAVDAVFDVVDGGVVYAKGVWHESTCGFGEEIACAMRSVRFARWNRLWFEASGSSYHLR